MGMRAVVYQEPHPERARTYRSIAEAFRLPEYTCAIERGPRLTRRQRALVDSFCWVGSLLLFVAAFTAPLWWPR